MKKLFIGVVAALCCFALIAPAMAEVKMGGMVTMDYSYWSKSKELVLGGLPKNATTVQDDYSTVEFAMPQPFNRLHATYKSDDGKIGGYIEIRTGGQKSNGNSALGENGFTWEYAWIDWNITKDFSIRAGRQPQVFSVMTPQQFIGHGMYYSHIVGAGFGNFHSGTSRDGISMRWVINPMFIFQAALFNPDSDRAAGEVALPGIPGLGHNAWEANYWPRVDLELAVKLANWTFYPSFTYLKQEWDQVGAGSDDSFDIWAFALGWRASYGPFSFAGEVNYGKNYAAGGYVGGVAGPSTWFDGNSNSWKIEDGTEWAWFVQLGWNFGPWSIQGIIGMDDYENDGSPVSRDAAEYSGTRWMYGLMFPIKVAKNFEIAPQIWYYDYDGSAVNGARSTTADVDNGDEINVGVRFNLTF